MTIDGMMEEDAKRIFGDKKHVDLRTINIELGNKVMYAWIDSAVRASKDMQMLPYQIPRHIEWYILSRYKKYKEEMGS